MHVCISPSTGRPFLFFDSLLQSVGVQPVCPEVAKVKICFLQCQQPAEIMIQSGCHQQTENAQFLLVFYRLLLSKVSFLCSVL